MVGVEALIASWCKIFKPDSHLVASSLESAGEVNTNGMLLLPGKTSAERSGPRAIPAPYGRQAWEAPVLVSGFAQGHQEGISFTPSWL